jgi:hypothetical protein
VGLVAAEVVPLLVCLAVTWGFGRLERRTLADYGLPWQRAFGVRFWQGAGLGLVSLSTLMLALFLTSGARLDALATPTASNLLLGFAYVLLFVTVALFEESSTRGYLQHTLAAGIGFWPAAVVTSLLFALPHLGNLGESPLGVANAGGSGLLFCLLLRRTGNLWAAIGFHVAWDWGENWLYGVADSGAVLPGHLLHATPAGPIWLSGGSVGPEGSVLCTTTLIVTGLACAAVFRRQSPDAAQAAVLADPGRPASP